MLHFSAFRSFLASHENESARTKPCCVKWNTSRRATATQALPPFRVQPNSFQISRATTATDGSQSTASTPLKGSKIEKWSTAKNTSLSYPSETSSPLVINNGPSWKLKHRHRSERQPPWKLKDNCNETTSTKKLRTFSLKNTEMLLNSSSSTGWSITIKKR